MCKLYLFSCASLTKSQPWIKNNKNNDKLDIATIQVKTIKWIVQIERFYLFVFYFLIDWTIIGKEVLLSTDRSGIDPWIFSETKVPCH